MRRRIVPCRKNPVVAILADRLVRAAAACIGDFRIPLHRPNVGLEHPDEPLPGMGLRGNASGHHPLFGIPDPAIAARAGSAWSVIGSSYPGNDDGVRTGGPKQVNSGFI